MFTVRLLIDGYPETLLAAQFAIGLVPYGDGLLNAHAIVDGNKLLSTTGFAGPGLCGSGVFVAAYEQMVSIMIGIDESLIESLRARAEGSNVPLKECISVGDPTELISQYMTPVTLLVVGGHPSNVRLAQSVHERTSCPVAIVGGGEDGQLHVELLLDGSPISYELKAFIESLTNKLQLVLSDGRDQVGDPSSWIIAA